jgi:hypothetical protein
LSGSPNITMSHAQAVAQNQQIKTLLGCDKGSPSQISTCLRAVSARAIADSTPDCYNTDVNNLPHDGTQGQGWCGLTIADGITVLPLFPAMRSGLIDVPLIIQNVALEPAIFGNESTLNMTNSEFSSIFTDFFQMWPSGTSSQFFNLYANEKKKYTPGYVYYGFLSDITFTCGLRDLTIAAAQGFKSPVYSVRVDYEPSKPFPTLVPFFRIPYSVHNMDYAMTMHWFSYGLDSLPPYSPNANDLIFAQNNFNAWSSLLFFGVAPKTYKVAKSAHEFPQHINYVHYGGKLANPINTIDLGLARCNTLKASPLSFDQKYWCIN